MKTKTPNVPFLTSTQVYHLILFIYASKFMSLQIKKSHCLPKLLAQICTKMEEWVRDILLLSNQSEVPKAYDTEKQTKKKKKNIKKPHFQHPKCPTWLSTWTWNTSWSATQSKPVTSGTDGQLGAFCWWTSGPIELRLLGRRVRVLAL